MTNDNSKTNWLAKGPRRPNKTRREQMNHIPIAVLAAEYGLTVDELAKQLAAEITIESGLRVVSPSTAERIYEERVQRVKAEVQARRDAAAQPNPLRQRVKGIIARDRQLRETGTIDPTTPAAVVVAMGDGNSRLDSAARRMDELLAAERRGEMGVMTIFKPQQG
jgi:hypothetical protein